MLITVPSAASAKLSEMLTPDQRTQFIADVMDQDGYLYFVLQNSDGNTVYVESGSDATLSAGVAVPPGATISLKTDNLSKIRMISETAPNFVRLLSVGSSFAPDNTALLFEIVKSLREIANPLSLEATSGRMRVVLDALGGAQTLGTVTTLAQLAGVPANSVAFDLMAANWAQTVRPRIT